MDPVLSFTATTALTSTIGLLLAGITSVGAASILVPFVTNRILPKIKETHLSDFLPFEGIGSDGQTVFMKNQTVARYYYLAGRDQSFMEGDEAIAAARQRKDFLDSLSELGVVIRIFTHREKTDLNHFSDFPNENARKIAFRWNQQFENAYRTLNIICISAKNEQKLEEAQQVLETSLNNYGVYPITQDAMRNPERLTLGGVLGKMCSPLSKPEPKSIGSNLSDVLAGDVVWFRPDGIIEFSQGSDNLYGVILGIKKLGDDMSTSMSMELSSLPIPMTVFRHITPMGKTEALIKLEQHRKLATATSLNQSVAEQFEAATAFVEAMDEYRSALCTYTSSIIVYGKTLAELKANEISVRNIISSNGFTPVRETGATQATWFLQFPTLELIPRPYKIFTFAIAFDYTLDKPAGGVANSDWGPGPIALFKTSSNTVYQHQFHISDQQAALGHGVVIAPTGSGKTVLMEFLSLMSSRHKKVKHYFFDRYRGTAVYNLAMGGKYLSLNSEALPWSVDGGMNPFDCPDTEDNRNFLKLWISTIARIEQGDHKSIAEISDAVDVSFEELDQHERSLAAIHEAGFPMGSIVRQNLMRWVDPTQYGPIFNADRDSIDLKDNWLTTFDMTKLLEDTELGAATVSYLMHRIRGAMNKDNSPGFIFIDETEPLLRDPNFLNLFRVALQEFRKIRGVVISVFQRPEALKASGVSQLVRQQSGTYYLFQNPGAKMQDYAEFELNEKETAFVLGKSSIAKKLRRSILLKRPLTGESVIVDVDLSPIGSMIKLFSSSSEDVSLVSDLYRQFEGRWVERYINDDAP